MITTSEQLNFSIQQLDKLRQHAQTLEADPAKDILFKEMELAGVQGMIVQNGERSSRLIPKAGCFT